LRLALHLGREFGAVGHDGDHLRAERGQARLRLRQGVDADAAIRAPMSAMESHNRRTLGQQIVKADETAIVVGQHERRHRLTDLWRTLAGAVLLEARDQPVDRFRRRRNGVAHGIGEHAEPRVHRRVEIARAFERLFDSLAVVLRHR
jgi:hypothetical protein